MLAFWLLEWFLWLCVFGFGCLCSCCWFCIVCVVCCASLIVGLFIVDKLRCWLFYFDLIFRCFGVTYILWLTLICFLVWLLGGFFSLLLIFVWWLCFVIFILLLLRCYVGYINCFVGILVVDVVGVVWCFEFCGMLH